MQKGAMNQMYKSPIEIVSKIEQQIVQQQEENVIRAILDMGVNVDKEELLKALKYDRDQYNKGYEDGVREFVDKLNELVNFRACIGESHYELSVTMREIDNILKETVGE